MGFARRAPSRYSANSIKHVDSRIYSTGLTLLNLKIDILPMLSLSKFPSNSRGHFDIKTYSTGLTPSYLCDIQ